MGSKRLQVPAAEILGHIGSGELDALVRTLLDTIVRVTGFESSYFTVIDWTAGTQEVRYSTGVGALDVPEGAVVPWEDTLCRRALVSGTHATSDADASFGTDNAGHDLGIVSYVSVPVVTHDRGIYGTLCAASTRAESIRAEVTDLLGSFAAILGDQVDRERALVLERVRADEAERRLHARTMLLAESEHRVKTPLTVIRGAALLLEEHWEKLPDDRRRASVSTIVRQSDDLVDCIEVLLAQAREERDELIPSPTAIYVAPVLEQVAADHGRASTDHTISVDTDHRVVARIDVVSLRQLLGHLIDNAMKYTPPGGRIALSCRAEGDRALITVADDGPGLPSDVDPFAPFTRGAESDGQVTGTGLGLHIVRTIAARAGGEVSARNAPTGGAVFVIDLPGP